MQESAAQCQLAELKTYRASTIRHQSFPQLATLSIADIQKVVFCQSKNSDLRVRQVATVHFGMHQIAKTSEKVRAILLCHPNDNDISVFLVGREGKLTTKNSRDFRRSHWMHEKTRREFPIPMFNATSEDVESVIPCDSTEGALWSNLFDDDRSRGITMDDFLDVIHARHGLESVF
jgi:hypothetical protein